MAPENALATRQEGTLAPVVPTFEALIGQAIQAGAPVETMEKLLDMRERLRQEQARTEYFEALSSFQETAPSVPKVKQADRYKYAPLDVIVATIRPHLRANGLSYRFDTQFEAQPPAQLVTCTITHVGGHAETSSFRTPIDGNARVNDMQKSASAQTYAKRYALCNALGIVTADEDDDGRGAYTPPPPRPRPEAIDRAIETANRRERRPVGGTVTLPGHTHDPVEAGKAFVQRLNDEAEPDTNTVEGDGDLAPDVPADDTADLREMVVALANEYLLQTNAAAKKLGPSPAVSKKAREFLDKLSDKNYGIDFDDVPAEDLERLSLYLRAKLEEAGE